MASLPAALVVSGLVLAVQASPLAGRAAATPVCSAWPYKAAQSFASYAPFQSFCSSKFPVAAVTVTSTVTPAPTTIATTVFKTDLTLATSISVETDYFTSVVATATEAVVARAASGSGTNAFLSTACSCIETPSTTYVTITADASTAFETDTVIISSTSTSVILSTTIIEVDVTTVLTVTSTSDTSTSTSTSATTDSTTSTSDTSSSTSDSTTTSTSDTSTSSSDSTTTTSTTSSSSTESTTSTSTTSTSSTSTSTTPTPTPSNLVTNGGFDGAVDGAGAVPYWSHSGNIVVGHTQGLAYSKTQYAAFDSRAGAAIPQISQTLFSSTSGTAYSLTFYYLPYNISGLDASSGNYCDMLVAFGSQTLPDVKVTNNVVPAASPVTYTQYGPVAVSASQDAAVLSLTWDCVTYGGSSVDGTMFVDDVSLVAA